MRESTARPLRQSAGRVRLANGAGRGRGRRAPIAGRPVRGHDRDMNARIVVVPPSAETGEIARELAPAGFELALVQPESPQFAAALGDAAYMVCYPSVTMADAFYRAAPRLRLVQLLTAGYDNVDLAAARRAKVPVANNGGANAISVSEHAMMLMLTVARRVIWQHGNVSA